LLILIYQSNNAKSILFDGSFKKNRWAASPSYASPMQNEVTHWVDNANINKRPPAMRDKLQGNIYYFNTL
jgi:hypothetical protein